MRCCLATKLSIYLEIYLQYVCRSYFRGWIVSILFFVEGNYSSLMILMKFYWFYLHPGGVAGKYLVISGGVSFAKVFFV